MTGTSHGIVVGYDGSQGGVQALNWALRAAHKRGVPLTVCHVWKPACPMPLDPTADVQLSRRAGARVLAEAERYLRELAEPTLELRLRLTAGSAALALCEDSAEADMVVVGARGRGTVAGLLMGSVREVSRQVVGGPPGDALLAAAVQAQLLVVGPHGRNGTRGTRLGPVARALLRHASCPVGVIRPVDCGPGGFGAVGPSRWRRLAPA